VTTSDLCFRCRFFSVCAQEGTVRALPGVDTIRRLRSFRKMELAVQPGMSQKRTTDCFTRPGSVQLCHEDASVLAHDVGIIRALEVSGMGHDRCDGRDGRFYEGTRMPHRSAT
jgi:hypothetical protein